MLFICDEIDLQQVILSHFVSEAYSGLKAGGCERENNAGRTRFQPPDLQS